MRGEFSFREYLGFRNLSTALSIFFALLFLLYQYLEGNYTAEKSAILFFLCLYKILDGYVDVYESELQRRGKLYKTGQSLFFRTLFAVVLLLITLLLTKNLFLGVILMNLCQFFCFYFFCLSPLKKTIAIGVERHFSFEAGKRLIMESFFLFISVFLDFYVFSSSKYAVDAVMGSSFSGIYNLLFMPSNFIYLLANFIIRPVLPRLAALWQEGKAGDFRKEEGSLMKKVLLLSFVLLILAVLLSPLALWILERLLGETFYGKMTAERFSFCLLILGGCFYALANLEYYLLVTKRRQKKIFAGYLIASVLSFLTADYMLERGGFFFGSLQFAGMMLFLFLFFFLSEKTGKG